MEILLDILTALSLLLTIFTSVFCATYLLRSVGRATDTDPIEEDSVFYLPGWQKWEMSDLLAWLVTMNWPVWLIPMVPGVATILLIFVS